ncbi:MAG: aspartate carbamoyltransferase regulatory subunit [Lachnospiraceae bacterium]|nr:aspartate carbamoyltransferase regulatory subunit [Lachnospiraceae bacterium]
MLNISGINEGLVIDHIHVGDSMKLYSYLKLEDSDCCVAIIKNAKSNKMGRKDIVKIEGPLDIDINLLGAISHKLTVNVIKNGVIVDKVTPKLPDTVTNIIKCKNPRCVTSVEPNLSHIFRLTDKENAIYRCMYCEQQFKLTDIVENN